MLHASGADFGALVSIMPPFSVKVLPYVFFLYQMGWCKRYREGVVAVNSACLTAAQPTKLDIE